MVNPYKLIAGLGAPTVGVGSSTPVELTWPAELRQGLTFGELQTIDAWIRNYLPPIGTVQSSSTPPYVVNWYPGSAHYATVTQTKRYTNELGESPAQIVAAVIAGFNSLQLANKQELQPAALWHLHLLGNRGWFDAQGNLQGERFGHHFRAGWPLTIHRKPGTVLGKLREFGLEGWHRYWAAMAIGRDLFAEKFEEVGGVQLGLQDMVSDLQESGTAVKGRWEPLAGRWNWKGFDLQGRPLLTSAPLIPPPVFAPQDAEFTRGRNTSIWKFVADLLGNAADGQVAIAQLVPVLTGQFNQLAKLTGDSEIAAPPATAVALGQLFASYYNLLGLDVYRQLRDYGGEDLANVLRDEAAARYPVATAALFEAAI